SPSLGGSYVRTRPGGGGRSADTVSLCAQREHGRGVRMQIAPFEIERFYEQWEFRAELMLSSSDCESRPVRELLSLEPDSLERLLELRLGYTEVPGSPELRAAIAGRYETIEPGDVLALAAAEEGIFTLYHALLAPGDHVVVETPCYGSALEVARSTGA